MSDNSYELVFYGTLVDGFSESETKQHVAQLFKTSVDQVERMFTGKRVVIRNKLDRETALKYIQAMKKRGAECQIEVMGASGIKADLGQSTSSQSSASQASSSQASSPVSQNTATSQPAEKTVVETDNASGLSIAGEKVDEILLNTHFVLDPVGIRLAEEQPEVLVEHHVLDDVSLAPVGADLCDEKQEIPVSLPDISNLSLESEND